MNENSPPAGAGPITNVYVDGFNLYYGCLKGGPNKWLDPDRLCRNLLKRNQIQRIRYFTARVSAGPATRRAPSARRPIFALSPRCRTSTSTSDTF